MNRDNDFSLADAARLLGHGRIETPHSLYLHLPPVQLAVHSNSAELIETRAQSTKINLRLP